jgi:hypothetical protein
VSQRLSVRRRQRIAIVIVFIGPPPVWLPAFVRSCRANPDVQWLIYTDFNAPASLPSNISVTRVDLRALNERASDALGVRLQIGAASLRKLCDLKPAYGLMFADDLKPFEWWAYSDLDIVWGDIGGFVTDDLLERHNIISSRQRKVGGPFTLFRNTDAITRTFQSVPGVTAVLQDAQYRRLDENLLTDYLRTRMAEHPIKGRPRLYWDTEMTMSAAYQKALPDDSGGYLWWRDGRTFDAEGRERMYLHFHKMKEHMTSIDFGCGDVPASFAITRAGIFARSVDGSSHALVATSDAEVGTFTRT